MNMLSRMPVALFVENLKSEVVLEGGRIQWITDSGLRVIKAESLLMKPEVGDSVLIASDGSGGAICAVIGRSSNSSAVYELSGEMNYLVANELTIDSRKDLSLLSQGDIQASAPVGSIRLAGEKILITALDSIIKTTRSLIQRVDDYLHKSANTTTFSSSHHFILAEDTLKLDSERIDLG